MQPKTFPETLAYLYERLPMYQRDGAGAFKKDLSNTQEICWHLGLPQWKFNSIHVAGTNGKGSVSSMMASVLKEAGFKVGLYTSPHLRSFTERIRINGREVSEKWVVNFVAQHHDLIERIQPSFFELTVAMAFEYFAQKEVDIAVVEVGLGGRLDSTNILKPEMCVITNISLDHQAMLGQTLPLIAGEKAGIIKSYTPVVIGQQKPETYPVFQATAEKHHAPLFMAQSRFDVNCLGQDFKLQRYEVMETEDSGDKVCYTIDLDLAGGYQSENLRTALAALAVLREDGWNIPDKAIRTGMSRVRRNTGLRGRMEQLGEKPLILCDTAHNEAGIEAVMHQLASIPHEQLHLVWGMVNDKDHTRILSLLPEDAQYYWVKPDLPRGLSAHELQEKAHALGLNGQVFDGVVEGLAQAKAAASPQDLIFVGGSTFTVAEVL